MIDLHSHILPGIDDGAKDWDESLWMLSLAAEDSLSEGPQVHQLIDGSIERLANIVRKHLDMESIYRHMGLRKR